MENQNSNNPDSNAPAAVISVSPIVLSAPGRGEDLQIRVSAPITGQQLPVIVFAHGYGSSLDGYAPLVNFWAARGFVVIQPTFLDSRTLALSADDPRTASIWRFRVEDVKRILDNLTSIEASVPGLIGRLDTSRIAAVGHSFGAQTTGMLLGARIIGSDGALGEDLSDSRIKVGVLLTPAGKGGADLSHFAAEHYPFMNPGYAEMTKPTLVVAGDNDISPLTVRGWDWFTDAYTLSPGANWLVTLFGGEHLLGGISGYLVTETSDENPERVAAVQELTWAYLRSALYTKDDAWINARTEFLENAKPLGKIQGKFI
ncbi:alpha/beta hydrolase family protein [Dyadobacter psychrotolerans]|uniref:Alpha/beta fold hydrolase n=1 Tax=Dyadobacter psychrotolerans TaxID=2541721 RepID=A0A4R5DXE4_9BACT|nr:alpha/beta fold hydrolase [Dyadobacter psychrotolerans]TDE17120.1 alpha/beta fold hydrolase [Dyadobacter psychrotolerans]